MAIYFLPTVLFSLSLLCSLVTSQAAQTQSIVDSVVNDPKFTIEYKLNYKVVTNKVANEVYILYTDPSPPSVAEKYDAILHVPVATVGSTDPQLVGYFELLGKIPALKYLAKASDQPMICSNAVLEDISDGNTTFANEVDVAFFQSKTPRSTLNATNAVTVSITDELRPLAKLLWLKCFAAFFNMEETAETVINSIATRYMGHSSAQKDQTFAIAWVQREDVSTWSTAKDTYRTILSEDAGGEMVPLDPLYTSKEQLRSDIHSAFMVIDESRSPIIEEALYWINDMGYASVEDAEFLIKKRLWRIGKTTNANGIDDWEVRSAARPDLVLEDVITARYRRSGIQYIALATYKRHFLAELTSSEDSVVLQQQACSGSLLSEPAVWVDWPKSQIGNLNNTKTAEPRDAARGLVIATVAGIILGIGFVGFLVFVGTKKFRERWFVRMNEEPEMQMRNLN